MIDGLEARDFKVHEKGKDPEWELWPLKITFSKSMKTWLNREAWNPVQNHCADFCGWEIQFFWSFTSALSKPFCFIKS